MCTTFFILIISFLCMAVTANPIDVKASSSCPASLLVTRAHWRAQPPLNRTALPVQPARFVVIHHTATTACTTAARCALAVRNIQHNHMNTRRWWDIGYNFLIGGDGHVYEGRGWTSQGAHATTFNNRSVGVAFIGSFVDALPAAIARQAAQQLIACGVSSGRLSASYRLMGHRQVPAATECPGATLFAEIQEWPHFAADPNEEDGERC